MAKGVWKDFVAAVAKFPFEYEWMRPLIVAQSILESGRGTTILSKDHCNFNGMKYRESVAHFGGIKFKYVTPSEDGENGTDHPGWDWFFEFPDYETAIKTWQAFWFRTDGTWTPYPRVKEKDPAIMANLQSFLSYIGPIYCPYFEQSHSETYASYIINKCLPEASKLLKEAGQGAPKPMTTDETIDWIELNRTDDGKPAATAYATSEPKYTHMWTDKADLLSFIAHFPKANSVLVADTCKKIIPKVPDFGETAPIEPPKPKGKKILIDPGHSEAHWGARGKNPDVQEEDLNRYQAQLLKEELEALGLQADIIDPMNDDLYAIGQASKGYNAFISLHLNAYARKEFYTCTMCHSSKQSPSSKSAKVAGKFAEAVAAAIGNKCFEGSGNGWPKGVMAVGLSVLSGAASVNCPLFFLSEAEFIDDETEVGPIKERLVKAMKAGAKVLAENV